MYDVSKAELLGKSKNKKVADARAHLAYRMSKEMGWSGSNIAKALLATPSAVSKMIRKGEHLEQNRE